MRLHYFVLVILVKVWPKLFKRYFREYVEIYEQYFLEKEL